MKFVIEIECGNAAFDDTPFDEVRRILDELSHGTLYRPGLSVPLFDINGNKVGFARFEESK